MLGLWHRSRAAVGRVGRRPSAAESPGMLRSCKKRKEKDLLPLLSLFSQARRPENTHSVSKGESQSLSPRRVSWKSPDYHSGALGEAEDGRGDHVTKQLPTCYGNLPQAIPAPQLPQSCQKDCLKDAGQLLRGAMSDRFGPLHCSSCTKGARSRPAVGARRRGTLATTSRRFGLDMKAAPVRESPTALGDLALLTGHWLMMQFVARAAVDWRGAALLAVARISPMRSPSSGRFLPAHAFGLSQPSPPAHILWRGCPSQACFSVARHARIFPRALSPAERQQKHLQPVLATFGHGLLAFNQI